jgi:hypothetical protein
MLTPSCREDGWCRGDEGRKRVTESVRRRSLSGQCQIGLRCEVRSERKTGDHGNGIKARLCGSETLEPADDFERA